MQVNGETTRGQSLNQLAMNGQSHETAISSTPILEPRPLDGDIQSPSPSMTLSTRSSWLPILESEKNQLVLYNSTSHALTITPSSLLPVRRMPYDYPQSRDIVPSDTQLAPVKTGTRGISNARMPDDEDSMGEKACPWCSRPYTADSLHHHMQTPRNDHFQSGYARDGLSRRAPNYFKLLEQANHEAQSRPASPPLLPGSQSNASFHLSETGSPIRPGTPETPAIPAGGGGIQATRLGLNTHLREGGTGSPIPGTPKRRFGENSMAQGYFAAFFKEEKRLGMGANGTVYLCQHVLDDNYLGHFAVKKIAVGHSHEYLLRILKEVRLLETLRHPNIVSYHHSWLETTRFSSFGPSIPTLHVLMEWAECGSLDDLIDARQGKGALRGGSAGGGVEGVEEEDGSTARSARIRAFRANRKERGSLTGDPKSRKNSAGLGVHLLSAEEIKSFMIDIVSGLAFLHERSILHLDLKLGNVLLTKDEDRIISRAMLSDFGTSQDALQGPRIRSGNTGTVEYSAPEALQFNAAGKLQQVDSRSDMWSLGMILHKLIFFRLPYPDIGPADVNGIEREVLAYPGWKTAADPGVVTSCKRRGLPRELLTLLEGLLSRNPRERPSSDRVLAALKEGSLESHPRGKKRDVSASRATRGSSSSPTLERTAFTPEALSLTLVKPSDLPPPEVITDEEDSPDSPPASPLLAKIRASGQGSFAESLTTLPALLLPAPVRALRRTRWRNVRTALLVLKIVSLSRACSGGYPVMWMQVLATALAAMDVWKEGDEEDEMSDLQLSVALCCVHFLLLGVIRWYSRLGLCVA